jgi:uncharacterized protein (DUF433 family)
MSTHLEAGTSNPDILGVGMRYPTPVACTSVDGAARESNMSELHRITVNPEQNGGRPSIRGLRMRVKDVLELLEAGVSREEILADYSYLEEGDITAALEYAAGQSDHPDSRAH